MRKLIIFLVRKKLGLKKNEHFRFDNQIDPNTTYFFTDEHVMKKTVHATYVSSVSLNWLLDPECKIERIGDCKG